jgi:hypothetical protein
MFIFDILIFCLFLVFIFGIGYIRQDYFFSFWASVLYAVTAILMAYSFSFLMSSDKSAFILYLLFIFFGSILFDTIDIIIDPKNAYPTELSGYEEYKFKFKDCFPYSTFSKYSTYLLIASILNPLEIPGYHISVAKVNGNLTISFGIQITVLLIILICAEMKLFQKLFFRILCKKPHPMAANPAQQNTYQLQEQEKLNTNPNLSIKIRGLSKEYHKLCGQNTLAINNVSIIVLNIS